MSSEPSEIHVEHLLGRRVRDANGIIIGRVEELVVEIVDGEPVVTEFHIGAHALLERLGGMALKLPFLQSLLSPRRLRRVTWQQMDLSDPRRPRTRD